MAGADEGRDSEVGYLAVLSDEARRFVLSRARRRRFSRGEVIFHEGDPADTLHLVEKGHVAVRVATPLGDVATLAVIGPGEALGEGALLAPDGRRSASAVTIEGAETRSITFTDFEALRREDPAIERVLTEVLAAQVRRLSGRLVEALYVPAEARIVRRLLELGATFDGNSIPLTQEDLAALAGTTRPTVNRVLRRAEHRGHLELGRGRVTIVDREALERSAG